MLKEGEGNCADSDHSTESDNRHSLDYLDPLDADYVPGSSVGGSGGRRSKRLHSALPDASTKRSRVAALNSTDDEGSDDSLFLQLPESSRYLFCHGRTKVVLMVLSSGCVSR